MELLNKNICFGRVDVILDMRSTVPTKIGLICVFLESHTSWSLGEATLNRLEFAAEV